MKELRALLCILSLSTLALLGYGATLPGRAASTDPTITITQPVHGTVVQGPVTVAVAYKSVTGVNITQLDLYVDKKLYKSQRLDVPAQQGMYSFVWDTANVAGGLHDIWAYAFDAQGKWGSVAIAVYVNAAPAPISPEPPQITVNVRDGQVVSGLTRVMANIFDTGVKLVLFNVDKKFKFATNHPPYRFDWDTTSVPNGPHAIQVYTFDAAENKGESTPVVVNVQNAGGGETKPGESISNPPAPVPGTGTGVARGPETPVVPPLPADPRLIPTRRMTPAAPAGPTVGGSTRTPSMEIVIEPTADGPRVVMPNPPSMAQPPANNNSHPSVSAPRGTDVARLSPAEWQALAPISPEMAGARGGEPTGRQTARVTGSSSAGLVPGAVAPGITARDPQADPARLSMPAGGSSGHPTVTGRPAKVAARVRAGGPETWGPAGSFRPSDYLSVPPAAAVARPYVTAMQVALVPGGTTGAAGPSAAPQFGAAGSHSAAPTGSKVAAAPAKPETTALPPMVSARAGQHQGPNPVVVARVDEVIPYAPAGSRLQAPSVVDSPLVGTSASSPTVVATAGSRTVMDPSAGGQRTVYPAGRTLSPSVGAPAGSSAVMIAVVDPKSRQSVPIAMLMSRNAQPPAHHGTPAPASRAVPATTRPHVVVKPNAKGAVTVVYNGKPIEFGDVPPVCKDGMTLAPFRHIFEHSGGTVLWNNLIKQVRATADGRKVEFTIGEARAIVNNHTVQMQTAPYLTKGRAIVPLSFVRDALDVVVTYDPATGRITIAAK